MRSLAPAIFLSLALALGCGHTRTVTDADGKGKEETKPSDEDGAGKKRTASREARKEKPKAGEETTTTAQGVPLASSPAGLLKPGAERKIQEKLASEGLLKDDTSGKLDEPTREALRRFQDSHDLPATGFPDHETLRKMGLNPDELFTSKKTSKKDSAEHPKP